MTNPSSPLVSAIVTTHNRADLLPRAIDSVVRQTYRNLEIIIVDDGSSDRTAEIVRTYWQADNRIRYISLSPPRGACAARNHGIRQARGEFVAGLDDDDEWLPRRIEVLMQHFQPRYAYVCSRDCIVYKNRMTYSDRRTVITLDEMLYSNITGNQILTLRQRLLSVGGFDETLTANQDYDLWVRLLEKYGPALKVAETLQNIYRDHLSGRISRSSLKISGKWRVYLKNKQSLNKRQRRVRLLDLKRVKQKRITLGELIPLLGTGYFLKYFRHWLRMKTRPPGAKGSRLLTNRRL